VGVTLTLTGRASGTTTTDSNGYYELTSLSTGTYTLVPTKTSWTFIPENWTGTLTGNLSTDFIGTNNTTTAPATAEVPFKLVNNMIDPNNNEKITIQYMVNQGGRLKIEIYDLKGRLVKRVFNDNVSAGAGSVDWDGKDKKDLVPSSGIYLVYIEGPGIKQYKKMCILK